MTSKYTHLDLDKDVITIAGYYTPQKEDRLKYDNREVLYVIGQAIIESSCCGAAQWIYALVPGYIVKWKKETSADGLAVSEVEPIQDSQTRQSISQLIKEKEGVPQVEFW